MTRTLARIAAFAVLLAGGAMIAGCGVTVLSADDRADLAARLDEVRADLDAIGLEVFRNLDWCTNIVYARGAFSSKPQDPTCNLFDSDPQPFDAQAEAAFAALVREFEIAQVGVQAIKRWPPSATEGGRLVFDLSSGSNVGWSLVFSPGYELPESDPGEWVPYPIDDDWYFVWTDWN
jgi:hypothetical protein